MDYRLLPSWSLWPRLGRLGILAFVLSLALALPVQAVPAKPTAPEVVTIYKVYVTGIRDGKFTVSWSTDLPSSGYVDWGTSTALGNTTTDAVTSTRTHYVVIPPDPGALSESTTYYFRVRSGGMTDDNMGDYYTATTGPTLGIPTIGRMVWGYVYQPGGVTPATYIPVYLRVEDNNGAGSTGASQWVVARTDGSGVWYYSLNNVRTSNASAYFTFPTAPTGCTLSRGGER